MRKDGLDLEWFRRFVGGDPLAFNQLRSACFEKLCHFIIQKGAPAAFAEDLAQDTFYIVWARHPFYKNIDHVVRSLYHIAYIRVQVFLRSNIRTLEFDPQTMEDILRDPGVQVILSLADALEEVAARLKHLTPSQRKVIECLLKGNSIQQTAKLLGMTPNQVSVTKSDALKRLHLRRYDDEKNIFPFS